METSGKGENSARLHSLTVPLTPQALAWSETGLAGHHSKLKKAWPGGRYTGVAAATEPPTTSHPGETGPRRQTDCVTHRCVFCGVSACARGEGTCCHRGRRDGAAAARLTAGLTGEQAQRTTRGQYTGPDRVPPTAHGRGAVIGDAANTTARAAPNTRQQCLLHNLLIVGVQLSNCQISKMSCV